MSNGIKQKADVLLVIGIGGSYLGAKAIQNELDDDLNFLSHQTFNEINDISKQGTVLAHLEGGVPVIQIELEKIDAFHIGYLIYFFMTAYAMNAYLLNVNPFDQPGVEAYKRKITGLLKGKIIAN